MLSMKELAFFISIDANHHTLGKGGAMMQTQSKVFACGKVMALGAMYDTVEKLKWKLVSANSDAGILMTAVKETGMPFLVRVFPKQGQQIEVTVELASGTFSDRDSPTEAAAIFLEALTQIIEDALNKNRKEM